MNRKFGEPRLHLHFTLICDIIVTGKMAVMYRLCWSFNLLPMAALSFVWLLYSQSTAVEAIDCFKCVSLDGKNPACEDPFHNNFTSDLLEAPCMGGRKGRNGLFPATACLKLSGIYGDTGETIVVRGCALDSGTLTTDTEIIRMSHCGGLYFDERYVNGCLQSCDDGDGCNRAPAPLTTPTIALFISVLSAVIFR